MDKPNKIVCSCGCTFVEVKTTELITAKCIEYECKYCRNQIEVRVR